MLSDALHAFGEPLSESWLEAVAYGCLTPAHAGQFKAFVKQVHSRYQLAAILKGDTGWPAQPEQRDVLYFLAQSLRGQLLKELPAEKNGLSGAGRELAHRAKALLRDLAQISLEMAQMVVAEDGSNGAAEALPAWFMVEVVRDLPRLVEKRNGN
jgi:hypothetical protein